MHTSGDAPLLATKLFVPPPREQLVARGRLRDRLDAMRGGRVTLIAAAAGWGKSTLLADWAIATPGRVAWLSLDPGDDEPRRFLSYLIAALRGAGGIAPEDLADSVPSGADAVRLTATELLNAIAARGAPLSLILDDYHSIGSRAVHDVVQFVIDHLPPNLHLVLATRVDPPLTLSRLRARGLLLELRGEDLRFNAEETGAFLNGAMGLRLAAPAIQELERRTEGWAVGLQMAAISLAGRAQAEDFIERFSGSNRYVLDYLTDEVLDRQPDDVRDFLLGTSILTRLSAGLCDAVLQRGDSERILERLEDANLFLIPLDDVRFWYRYHHLFATLLQHQLVRSRSTQAIAELHRRAASWYLANGMPEPALEHALVANDVDGAAAILSVHALPRTLSGDAQSAVRWFNALPKVRIENDFDLLLIRAVAFVADYQMEPARETIDRAEVLLADDAPPNQRGAFLGVRGSIRRMTGELEEGTRDLTQAMALVTPDTFWFTMVSYQLGMNAMLRAEPDAVIEGLAVARSHHSRAEQIIIAVLAQTFTAYAELYRGQPERARALAEEMFAWIDLTEGLAPGRPLDAFPNAVLADVHLSWNELDVARAYADKSAEHGRRGFTVALFEASRSLARVAEAQRDYDTALKAAQDASRCVRGVRGYFHWYYALESMIQKVLFRMGDVQGVMRWVDTSEVTTKLMEWEVRRIGGFWCDTSLLLAARVRMDDALPILAEVEQSAVKTGRLLTRIEALVLRAIALARAGRVEDGVAAMHTALDLAARPRAIQPFAAEGAAILPLIERAAARVADRDFVTRVIAALDAPAKTAPAAVLSEREIEVLRLIAAGASNQDAGRKLFIAASTVKKHLENIYAKLAVGGRVEAIARAREMSLL